MSRSPRGFGFYLSPPQSCCIYTRVCVYLRARVYYTHTYVDILSLGFCNSIFPFKVGLFVTVQRVKVPIHTCARFWETWRVSKVFGFVFRVIRAGRTTRLRGTRIPRPRHTYYYNYYCFSPRDRNVTYVTFRRLSALVVMIIVITTRNTIAVQQRAVLGQIGVI